MRVITADEAAGLIQDGWTVVPGGFGCCGHPEAVTAAIGRRYRETGSPANINLLFSAGSGDRNGRGLDHLAQPGLVKRAIGGFWGFAPALGNLALNGTIEGHNWPQGVISQIFRACSSRLPWIISRIGLNTFVDPDFEGGVMGATGTRSLIKKVRFEDETFLQFPTSQINCAIIRGTRCDTTGNISMEEEVSFQDSLAQAQAARNAGGIVIAQVREIVPAGSLRPHDVRIPGAMITHVVVADLPEHPQTFAEIFNSAYVAAGLPERPSLSLDPVRYIIASRAVEELRKLSHPVVNLGIGIPADIGAMAHSQGTTDYTLTVESGQFGGIPAKGLSFGASAYATATIEQSSLFDFYDGGGIDIAFLGFAQIDSHGNVNVSHFKGRAPGIGGFANISQTAKRVVFCGTFSAGNLRVGVDDGKLRIFREGDIRKFVRKVERVSYSCAQGAASHQTALIITERAVFEFSGRFLKLLEIAPGIDIDRDIVAHLDSAIVVPSEVRIFENLHMKVY
jgi:propionate CoA-transferase